MRNPVSTATGNVLKHKLIITNYDSVFQLFVFLLGHFNIFLLWIKKKYLKYDFMTGLQCMEEALGCRHVEASKCLYKEHQL